MLTVFNQDIGSWDVSNVINMDWMFSLAKDFDQDLGGWNVSNVIQNTGMFHDVTLSIAHYDALLNGWASLPTLQHVYYFDAGNSQYCNATKS